MIVNIRTVVEFFDIATNSKRGDINSVIGMLGEDLNAAAFKHYCGGKDVDILHDTKVVQGFKKGKWLDRWIVNHQKKIVYQCEIKSWAATAIGGKSLSLDANIEDTQDAARYYLERLRTSTNPDARHPNGITKVLLPMRIPEKISRYHVRPLLIVWMPVTTDSTSLNPLFAISKIPSIGVFKKLLIFSVSLYFRNLYHAGTTHIELEIPNAKRRMAKLRSLFKEF